MTKEQSIEMLICINGTLVRFVNIRYGFVLQAAPGSKLTDVQLHNNTWHESTLVHHFWGNIAEKKVDVAPEIIKIWNKVMESFAERIKCKR